MKGKPIETNSMILEGYTRMIKTTDNFYPNYENDMVEVKVRLCNYNGKYTKLSVWGADDFGMEIEGKEEDFDRLKELYNQMPEPITKDWLLAHGFEVF